MTTETKKNPDYSNSAVNLIETRPEVFGLIMDEYYLAEESKEELRKELETTELFKRWADACTRASSKKDEVIKAIEEYGSYQNIETGEYAIKQAKQSKHYNAKPFMESENFLKYIPAVIEQSINVKALEGLVKGKLITEEELKETGVITTTETYAYIIK